MRRKASGAGDSRVIALAGNPNVGKSTVFNALTGLRQHTGNWPGKTVAVAQGRCGEYTLVDTPGAYSLMAHSAEEEAARSFICFGGPDAVIVVCDATALERNLNLVLQIMEISRRVVVCVNLMDEAERKGIRPDLAVISARLGVPVVGAAARRRGTLPPLVKALDVVTERPPEPGHSVRYPEEVERAVSVLAPVLREKTGERLPPRWTALKLLEGDKELIAEINKYLGTDIAAEREVAAALDQANTYLRLMGVDADRLRDMIVSSLVAAAEEVCAGAVSYEREHYSEGDRRLDRLLTGKLTGWPVMLLLLCAVLWLTIKGANYPSSLLSELFARGGERLLEFFAYLNAPEWLTGVLIHGAYRVLTFVVAVMLPPMAIFFPLFTLLEDAGYLPRVAYNLDGAFAKCGACGKQALTMWSVDIRMRTKVKPGQTAGGRAVLAARSKWPTALSVG